jgi:hypothetical protein
VGHVNDAPRLALAEQPGDLLELRIRLGAAAPMIDEQDRDCAPHGAHGVNAYQ